MTSKSQREEMIRRLEALKKAGHEGFGKTRNNLIDYHFVEVVLESLKNHEIMLELEKKELNNKC